MYSFAQRADTRVVDEPLYGHYLRVSGADHPGREEVLASMDCDGERVVREVVLGPCDRPISFQKHMAHHLVSLDEGFLSRTTNVLLVRDPREMLSSLARQLPGVTLGDTGLPRQIALLETLRSKGQVPPVLDAGRLLADPQAILSRLCSALNVPFLASMLGWPAGPRPEDGVWARFWYAGVHGSTGFRPPRRVPPGIAPHLAPLLDACLPLYQRLFSLAL